MPALQSKIALKCGQKCGQFAVKVRLICGGNAVVLR